LFCYAFIILEQTFWFVKLAATCAEAAVEATIATHGGASLGSLIRVLLLATLLVIAYFVIMRPTQLRQLGKQLRKVGYAYVAAILISAALRLMLGWGS
jgi:hypothetical protein